LKLVVCDTSINVGEIVLSERGGDLLIDPDELYYGHFILEFDLI
jgi:hypothetical protein